jgi:hypothetical protein
MTGIGLLIGIGQQHKRALAEPLFGVQGGSLSAASSTVRPFSFAKRDLYQVAVA